MKYVLKHNSNPNIEPDKPDTDKLDLDIVDPLCSDSKWWCENYKLNLIKLSFIDETTRKNEYRLGFNSTLNELKNYVEFYKSYVLSQQYYDELAAYQANVRDYFPRNPKYQKLLNQYLYPKDEIIDFIKLEELFSELKFHPPIKNLNRKRLFNEALRLIAYHQIAPPPWLAELMLNEFKENSRKHILGKNEKEFNRIVSIVNERSPSESLEKISASLGIDKRRLDSIIELNNYRKQAALLGLSYLP